MTADVAENNKKKPFFFFFSLLPNRAGEKSPQDSSSEKLPFLQLSGR